MRLVYMFSLFYLIINLDCTTKYRMFCPNPDLSPYTANTYMVNHLHYGNIGYKQQSTI